MHKSILIAASLATVLVLATAHRAVEAQSEPGPASSAAKPKAAKTKAPRTATTRGKRTATKGTKSAARGYLPGRKGPGQCGTYMFWKGGKCVDTRLPKK